MEAKKKMLLWIICSILALVTFYIVRVYPSYKTLNHLRNELVKEKNNTKKLNEKLNETNVELEKIDSLYYVEEFARNHLSMKKKDEIIYKVVYKEEE